MDNYSTYPSSLLVVSPTGIYRKHYYIGSQRIASRVGDGIATIFEGTPGGGGIQAKKSQQADSTASELEELKTLQQQDLLYYAAKAGIKTLEYAPYETLSLKEAFVAGVNREGPNYPIEKMENYGLVLINPKV